MKRVLFIITQSELGGAQRFISTLVPHLDRSCYQVAVAAGSQNNHYPLLEELELQRFQTFKLKHLQREIRPIKDLRACFEIKKLIKIFQPDILFLLSSKTGFLGSLVAKFSIFNFQFSIFYRIGGWTFNDPWPRWKKRLWIWIERISAHWKDVIIVNNRHDFEQAKRLGIKPRKSLELLHNGLDIENMKFLSREEARIKLSEIGNWKLEIGNLLIGTIANFYPAKGLEYLIEAINQLAVTDSQLATKIKLVIIGDGKLRPKLEQQIARHHLQDTILLAGQISNARDYLKAFDLYIQPSLKEGFPWAILEAMAAGLPVIATAVGAIPEIIKNEQNGLIVLPGNPALLASAITRLAKNHLIREAIGMAGSRTIAEQFSIATMIKRLAQLLSY